MPVLRALETFQKNTAREWGEKANKIVSLLDLWKQVVVHFPLERKGVLIELL
jgi:hypothetical protein